MSGDRKWAAIRRTAWGVGLLTGTALLFLWLLYSVSTHLLPPGPYEELGPAISVAPQNDPRHDPHRPVHNGPTLIRRDWLLTVVRDGRELRLSNFPTEERCEQRLKDIQSYDPATVRGKCLGPR